jgi:hypothetical protein
LLSNARGGGKKIHGPPPYHHPTFLGKGISKTPLKYFCKTSMSKTISKKIDKHFDVSFSSTFFLFYRVFGCFSAMGVQKHTQKTFCKKHRVEEFVQKNSTKKLKPFFSRFVSSRFWAFFDEGSSKTRPDPIPFSYSDPPTHNGGHRFFLPAPWKRTKTPKKYTKHLAAPLALALEKQGSAPSHLAWSC